jgi:uncharacterized protein YutE (UPF0331/DUF86 family)
MKLSPDRIRAKLEDIARAVKRLERFQEMSREDFLNDEDSQDIARSRLLTAMEAALNICYHVAATGESRVPEDYAECFEMLGDEGYIHKKLASKLANMARFRNRLVHMYAKVDYGQVYDIICNALKDLKEFSTAAANFL